MRKTVPSLVVLVSLALAAGMWAQAKSPSAVAFPAANGDRDALLKLEQDWGEAVARHDAAFIERVEADSYIYTDCVGFVGRKADDLARAKAGDCKIESFKLSGMKVQLHGNTAVVTGKTLLVGSDHGGSLDGIYRWTDVFVRANDGRWQVVASQATTMNKQAEIVVLPDEESSDPAETETEADGN